MGIGTTGPGAKLQINSAGGMDCNYILDSTPIRWDYFLKCVSESWLSYNWLELVEIHVATVRESIATFKITATSSGRRDLGEAMSMEETLGLLTELLCFNSVIRVRIGRRYSILTSNSQINWRIASNRIGGGALTFTPSTAGGGSTFTTPAVTISNAGNVGIEPPTPSNSRLPEQLTSWGINNHR